MGIFCLNKIQKINFVGKVILSITSILSLKYILNNNKDVIRNDKNQNTFPLH